MTIDEAKRIGPELVQRLVRRGIVSFTERGPTIDELKAQLQQALNEIEELKHEHRRYVKQIVMARRRAELRGDPVDRFPKRVRPVRVVDRRPAAGA